MWIVLGVLAVIFVVAMCSGEKTPEPRVRAVFVVDPPAKKTGFGEIFFGGLLICVAGYFLILILPYLLGAMGVWIACVLLACCFSGSK